MFKSLSNSTLVSVAFIIVFPLNVVLVFPISIIASVDESDNIKVLLVIVLLYYLIQQLMLLWILEILVLHLVELQL